ncbi:hypothetical protein [Corynebacterium heidelbergense]|uniref:hypothetical protein n=1 Tax=Corynebacterium heidelbergense TaxID=2055947 RepID=UPI0015EF723B|nr:hypothetical protein [Corynebacterium heidelbergense]
MRKTANYAAIALCLGSIVTVIAHIGFPTLPLVLLAAAFLLSMAADRLGVDHKA